MHYMDRMWFEDRWRALVAAGHSDAEAFEMLERGNPERAKAFMEFKVDEFLDLLHSDSVDQSAEHGPGPV